MAEPTDLSGLSWMVGRWRGENGTTVIEETWAAPLGGSMLGTFRLAKDGKVGFYEFMVIDGSEQGPRLRIKHYGADLVGWEPREEALDMVLQEQDGQRAVFARAAPIEWLTYERTGDTLVIRLEKGAERETLDAEFRFRVQ